MKLIQIYLNNSLRNFNYILYSEITKEAIVIDPYDSALVVKVCQEAGLVPKYLINTHDHYDHTKGIEKFLKTTGSLDLKLKDGEEFKLSSTERILCLNTPGHMREHFCYFLYESDKMMGVVTGDTVFNSGVGNCKNGGDPQLLYQTIRNFFINLSDDVIIYPSHDYFKSNLSFAKSITPNDEVIDMYLTRVEKAAAQEMFLLTTIGEEKLYNPFFRVFNKEYFEQLKEEYALASEEELFLLLRKKRDNW